MNLTWERGERFHLQKMMARDFRLRIINIGTNPSIPQS
jgi:hypothetical protein